MADYKWVATPLYKADNAITVTAASKSSVLTPSIEDSDCQALRFLFTYSLTPSLYLSNYNPKVYVKVEVQYKKEDVETDHIVIVINRDTKEAIAEIKGQDISSVSFQVINNSTSTLSFSQFEVYESEDVSPTQIAKVLKEETIRADLIHATTVIADAAFTQMLETNAKSRSARIAHSGQQVDYIHIEGMEIGFYTAILGDEEEQFTITTETAGIQTTQYYWYAIIEGDDAYKDLTTIDPRTVYPNISDSDRDAFRFMVLKPKSVEKKLSIEFARDEKGNLCPSIQYGAGDNNGNSRGYTYKNSNGFYHIYTKSNGENIGFVMDDDGVYIVGLVYKFFESLKLRDNGFQLKFPLEPLHNYTYVVGNDGNLTGILLDNKYLGTVAYEPGNI